MWTRVVGAALLLVGCKAELGGGPGVGIDSGGGGGDDAPLSDIDANVTVDAAPLGPWSAPQRLGDVSTTGVGEDDATLAPGGLELIFGRNDAADNGRKHLFVTRRAAVGDAWGTAQRASVAQLGTAEQTPVLSPDGLTLYFASNRDGDVDVYRATRATALDSFSNVTPLAEVNAAGVDKWFVPCDGGRYLLVTQRDGNPSDDIYEGTLGGGAPTRVGTLSSANTELGLALSRDCTTMYFASNRSGGFLLYTATRASATSAWPAPTPFTEFDAVGGNREDPFVASDGRTFLFTSDAAGDKDVYVSTR